MALALKDRGAEVEVIDGLEVNHLVHYASLPSTEPGRDLYLKMSAGAAGAARERRHSVAPPGRSRLQRPFTRAQRLRSRHDRSPRGRGARESLEQGSVLHLRPLAAHARERARLGACESTCTGSSSSRRRWSTGTSSPTSVSEDHPLDPIGIYGALKLGGEKLVIAYNQVFDMPYTIVRPSALYGPRCVSRRVSQAFIESAIVGDTSARRRRRRREDRLHLHRRRRRWRHPCIEHDGARNEIFNMTAGKGRSLRDLVTLVQSHFPEIEVEYVERDRLRPYRGTLSMDKARELIGHVPQVELEDGLRAVRRVVPRADRAAGRACRFVVREDAWLGRRLGCAAWTVEEADTIDAVMACGAGFFQVKVGADDVARVGSLEAAGFRTIDVNVTFRRDA